LLSVRILRSISRAALLSRRSIPVTLPKPESPYSYLRMPVKPEGALHLARLVEGDGGRLDGPVRIADPPDRDPHPRLQVTEPEP
jgi:hypothetical protein